MPKPAEKTDWKDKIIRTGYRALAKEEHPDHPGGRGKDEDKL